VAGEGGLATKMHTTADGYGRNLATRPTPPVGPRQWGINFAGEGNAVRPGQLRCAWRRTTADSAVLRGRPR